jgi:hypothetical protein
MDLGNDGSDKGDEPGNLYRVSEWVSDDLTAAESRFATGVHITTTGLHFLQRWRAERAVGHVKMKWDFEECRFV